uniref:IgGFc_binding domain-containing protein n=1 Tax=Strongyloides venezuelensis TaxID=75913 RepID=A0A0K0G423_STRVS
MHHRYDIIRECIKLNGKLNHCLRIQKMKALAQIVFLLPLTLGAFHDSTNTDGTEFVTSFLYTNAPDPQNFEFSLYFLPTTNTTTSVTCQYWSNKNSKMINITFAAKYKDPNKHIFVYNDVITDGHYGDGQPKNLTDPRLYITSTAPIKVIAKVFNLFTKQGDMYLVPSTSFASTKFLFKLPQPVLGREQVVHLLALPNKDTNAQIIVTGPQGHNLVNQTVKLNGALGGNQIILPITTIDVGPSIYISSDQPMVVIGAVICADLNAFNVNASSSNNTCDYAAYFPQQIGTWDCVSNLTTPDQRFTVGDHTGNIFISPADSTCGSSIPVSVYSNINPANVSQETLLPKLVSSYQIVHSYISELAVSSSNALLSMTRVGTPKATKNATMDGIFMHYVPDTTQYYSGETQFITLYDGDYYEIYVENYTINASLTLNGQNVLINDQTSKNLSIFNRTYTVAKITVPKAGLNVFNCPLNYIGYIISKNNGNKNTVYGYITGFNKSKLQTYLASDVTPVTAIVESFTSTNTTTTSAFSETTTTTTTTTTLAFSETTTIEGNTIYTTTQSTSKMNLNLITISLLFISKIFFLQ